MKYPRIAFILSDFSGPGCEMLLQMLQDPSLFDVFTPIVIGSKQVALDAIQQLGLAPIPFHVIPAAADIIDGRFNFIDVNPTTDETFTSLSVAVALDAVHHRYVDALVALPGPLVVDGSAQSLIDVFRLCLDLPEECLDWHISGTIRTLALQPIDATTELGEGIASEALRTQLTVISHQLRQDFPSLRPLMAVLSSQAKMRADLNDLHEEGVLAFGPFDAQSFVDQSNASHYDAVLLYGDAASLRAQLRSPFDDVPNYGYVSGLPVILTYPLATAQTELPDAPAVALRQAAYAAIDILRTRIRYRVASHNPLQKYWTPRGRDDFKLDLTKEE